MPAKLGLTCIPKKAIPIPDLTLAYLRHVEYANAEADVMKDAVGVFLIELVNEGLFWREAELRRMYRNLVLLWESMRISTSRGRR